MVNLQVPFVGGFTRLPEEETRFKDKVVVITGASSGIGMACALEFAAQGAKVVVAARREELLLKLTKQIKGRGGEAFIVMTDVRKIEDCENLMKQSVEMYGRIDILINNAGISMRANFEDLDLKVIRQLIDTNFYGAVYCTKFALPYLWEHKGSLIGISSISGLTPLPGRTGYVASKHALVGFLNTLRLENVDRGLNVLVVHPGFTRSEIREKALNNQCLPQGASPRNEGRMMSCETVARHIARAAYKRKRDLLLTPQGKMVTWLHRYFPWIAGRILIYEMSRETRIQSINTHSDET
ncbi:MAG: SDR family oxidoreductase [Bacteroidetes bacterium]|nr:SDR family oxidoreductase [Bacteroidota bacterium]